MTNAITLELSKIKSSPLHKSYLNTFYCNQVLYDNNGKLTSKWCKNRWCLVCNRNRIGKLINDYKPRIEKYDDWYFVTLTAKTVKGKDLSARIDMMLNVWRKIFLNASINKRPLMGVKKLECTVRPGDMYHPHFHFLIRGKDMAEWTKNQWLKHWMYETDPKAQDIRKADDKSYLEIFKYFTKLIVKDTPKDMFNPKPKRTLMHAEKMDVIFQAMRGRRVYASFGKIPKLDEEVSEVATIPALYEGCIFKWVDTDWVDEKTGVLLTGWLPSKELRKFAETCNVDDST